MEQAIAVAEMVDLDADVAVEWSRVAMMSMVKEINADPKNSAALMKRKYDQPCQMLLKRLGHATTRADGAGSSGLSGRTRVIFSNLRTGMG